MRAQHTSAPNRLVPELPRNQSMRAVTAIEYDAPRSAIRVAGPARAAARRGAAMAVRLSAETAGASTTVSTAGASTGPVLNYQAKEGGQ